MIEIFKTDHKERFERIFDENYRRLLFHALRFVQEEEEAEDIVAEVMFDFWKRIDEIELDKGITTYLYRAVSSRALNYLRRKNIAAVRLDTLESINEMRMEFISKETPDSNIDKAEIGTAIRSAISELPERCREVFVLSYVDSLKSKEIAEALNLSVRTVEAHIYKALKILRSRLDFLLSAFPAILLGSEFLM